MAVQIAVIAVILMKIRQGTVLNIYLKVHIYIYIPDSKLFTSYISPPPNKTGRYEFSHQNNHYLSDDYSDDEEENLHSK